ncbi:hypothetical protein FQN57_006805 [Myotisia sp. PD_48]|nr:hypothetical protein FQN57_006805 [Myotisia sp. PD_48]
MPLADATPRFRSPTRLNHRYAHYNGSSIPENGWNGTDSQTASQERWDVTTPLLHNFPAPTSPRPGSAMPAIRVSLFLSSSGVPSMSSSGYSVPILPSSTLLVRPSASGAVNPTGLNTTFPSSCWCSPSTQGSPKPAIISITYFPWEVKTTSKFNSTGTDSEYCTVTATASTASIDSSIIAPTVPTILSSSTVVNQPTTDLTQSNIARETAPGEQPQNTNYPPTALSQGVIASLSVVVGITLFCAGCTLFARQRNRRPSSWALDLQDRSRRQLPFLRNENTHV